jgi:hypothetical protein
MSGSFSPCSQQHLKNVQSQCGSMPLPGGCVRFSCFFWYLPIISEELLVHTMLTRKGCPSIFIFGSSKLQTPLITDLLDLVSEPLALVGMVGWYIVPLATLLLLQLFWRWQHMCLRQLDLLFLEEPIKYFVCLAIVKVEPLVATIPFYPR